MILLPLVIYYPGLCIHPKAIRDIVLKEKVPAQIRTQIEFRTGLAR
jgi:hypothetical protein